MKRRDLLRIASAAAAGLIMPGWWLWQEPRRIWAPGFTPSGRATAAEVLRLIRRWQREKEKDGLPCLTGPLAAREVTLAEIPALDCESYEDYLQATNRAGLLQKRLLGPISGPRPIHVQGSGEIVPPSSLREQEGAEVGAYQIVLQRVREQQRERSTRLLCSFAEGDAPNYDWSSEG